MRTKTALVLITLIAWAALLLTAISLVGKDYLLQHSFSCSILNDNALTDQAEEQLFCKQTNAIVLQDYAERRSFREKQVALMEESRQKFREYLDAKINAERSRKAACKNDI